VTTTFLLVRHAAHDTVGHVLAGRLPAIPLGETGRAQATRLAERLRGERFAALQASPRERTRETAEAIAAACGRSVETAPELDEVDFGPWAGCTFAELENDPRWRQWNASRSTARTAGGESMADVQARVARHMRTLAKTFPGEAVVLVTHAEIIRAALFHHLGVSADDWARFEIGPASITRIAVDDEGARLLTINETVE
jgi:broad specificity phosphatase PhoE